MPDDSLDSLVRLLFSSPPDAPPLTRDSLWDLWNAAGDRGPAGDRAKSLILEGLFPPSRIAAITGTERPLRERILEWLSPPLRRGQLLRRQRERWLEDYRRGRSFLLPLIVHEIQRDKKPNIEELARRIAEHGVTGLVGQPRSAWARRVGPKRREEAAQIANLWLRIEDKVASLRKALAIAPTANHVAFQRLCRSRAREPEVSRARSSATKSYAQILAKAGLTRQQAQEAADQLVELDARRVRETLDGATLVAAHTEGLDAEQIRDLQRRGRLYREALRAIDTTGQRRYLIASARTFARLVSGR